MQTSGQVLNQIQQLQQQQGYLTANQVSSYQQAYNSYMEAQAAQEQASASMLQAKAQSAQINQQVAMMNAVQQKYGLGGIAQSMGINTNSFKPTAQKNSNRIAVANRAPSWYSPQNVISTLDRNTKGIAGKVGNAAGGALSNLIAPGGAGGAVFNSVRGLF
jgi:hypothetical protein